MAAQLLQRFVETGHPIFQGASSLDRDVLKREKIKKKTIHFTAQSSSVELLFRIIHCANQLRVYGAMSSWIGQPSPAGAEPVSGKAKSVNQKK